jgi:hydrogenase maturation factor HypF (carbamoyltransferase family)
VSVAAAPPNASILATADAKLHVLSWLAIRDVGAYALTCRAAAALAVAYWCGADGLGP